MRHTCEAQLMRPADTRFASAYERSDMLARMAKQTIEANAGMPGAVNVEVKVTARALLENTDAQAADLVVCGALNCVESCLRPSH